MKSLLRSAAVAAFVATGSMASASTVTTYCPGTGVTTDREFTVTIEGPAAASCLAYGTGNINGNLNGANPDVFLTANPSYSYLGDNPLVEFTYTGVSALSGIWNIVVAAGYKLVDVAIGFKSGEGQLDPDWAVFGLPDDILSGSWAIASGRQSLSHAVLYGTITRDVTPPPVPVPAAGMLLVGGLGMLGAMRARRKTR